MSEEAIKEMLDDKRDVSAIAVVTGIISKVGLQDVTKIVIYGEPGPHCMLPWAAVYKGDFLSARVPCINAIVLYKEEK